MRRRDVLAGAAALAVAGGGAAVAIGGWEPWEDGEAIEEFELPGIDAPGSQAGTVVVPERGSVTVLELFATWCGVCADLMEPMAAVNEEVGEDVQFVSVTNEPLGRTVTEADVADWWERHDGAWQVAHDDGLELTSALGASGVPYTVVLDEDNVVTWSDSGYKSADELLEPIEAALDGDGMEV